jgi:hypothetical protein
MMDVRQLKATDPKRYKQEYERWSYGAADYEWWDYVYENFKEDAAQVGISVNDIRFCGFWSQGDGAGFTAIVNIGEWMRAHKYDVEWPALYMAYENSFSRANIDLASRGYSQSVDARLSYATEPEGMFTGLDRDTWNEMIDEQERDFDIEGKLKDYAEDMSHKLYRDLEAEYTHLTSEESYIEFCLANDEYFEETTDEIPA